MRPQHRRTVHQGVLPLEHCSWWEGLDYNPEKAVRMEKAPVSRSVAVVPDFLWLTEQWLTPSQLVRCYQRESGPCDLAADPALRSPLILSTLILKGLWRKPQHSSRSTAIGSQPPMSQGNRRYSLGPPTSGMFWNMREAKIKTTSKSVSNLPGTLVPWTLGGRLCLPVPQRSVFLTF